MKKVEIYTGSSCPYCVQAKELLKRKGIPFEETLVSWEDKKAWDAMMKRSGGMKTVPQIYIDDKLIGGFTDLVALEKAGKLAEMVS